MIAELIGEAKAASVEVERHREAMAAAAVQRRLAVRKLYEAGLSVRAIAEALEVSGGTVQGLLRE